MKRILVLFAMLIAAVSLMGKIAVAETISVKGSDTMVHLVAAWAEGFMKAQKSIDVSVTGGGSGTGIASLINKTTNIASSSRSMKDKEISLAKSRKVVAHEIKVALDGVSIIVHPSNPVKNLTMRQLKSIYTGEIKNWSELGGPNQKIMLLSRDTSSGTYVFFQEHVLQNNDYFRSTRMMPSTSAIVQTVSQDKGAIGYVGLGYAEEAGSKIKVLTVDKVEATINTIRSGKYPVARPLFLYTNGNPSGAVKTFIDYILGSSGQKIVKETGFVPL